MAAEIWGEARLRGFVAENWGPAGPEVMAQIRTWLARGDGAAVYQNMELGHPQEGHPQIISYGSGAAGILTDVGSAKLQPPDQMPDFPKQVNWRYRLVATCRKGASAREFEAAYADRSGVTVEQLHSWGRYAEPCDCGDEGCEGWAMGHQWEAAIIEDAWRTAAQKEEKEHGARDRD